MKTLLRIDASVRKEGSHSRELADYFQTRWAQMNPDSHVIQRDLAEAPVPHLDHATIAAFQGTTNGNSKTSIHLGTLSNTLIAELRSADYLLISSPLYNFNVPSPLKAYIDHVVRFGQTFTQNEFGYNGLLSGKSACIVTAQGGSRTGAEGDTLDFQGPYLTTILNFLGYDRVDLIALEGTNEDKCRRTNNIKQAHAEIDRLTALNQAVPDKAHIEWIGAFTSQDRQAITALRVGQVSAIEQGDAAAYAQLCTEDVLLMLQGYDVVAGRQQFLECETTLFRSTTFASIRQYPIRVERQGELAVETGRQEVMVAAGSASLEAFKAQRKYTHMLRKTPEGWRFAVLMSNNSL